MKITYLTHACLLIEINKLKIITDPWLVGPSWGGSLWHYPTHNYTPSNLPVPDIIFFSHGHDDHFHEETIRNLVISSTCILNLKYTSSASSSSFIQRNLTLSLFFF